jgi:hypothetical protein
MTLPHGNRSMAFLQVCYKIFEKIQAYVYKMNKIGDSYLPCIAMAYSPQVEIEH